ncbi:MAG: CHAT domain-containing protein [Deltaproteobacteria bacterium]|nr:CHAT domain-containing protein [Deltaproteobacteria bacterium]
MARTAHIRKSIAAGEFLLRLGEIPSARNVFITLIRRDYSIVEAHRGYIRCTAAQKQIPSLLNQYRHQLDQNPNDSIALYATGLCLTYVGGKKALKEARSLIVKAIEHQGQVEYFHQTLGYVLEVLETVHGEKGRLEAALESYLKAHFLNNPKDNPENAAHLLLNLGNVYFLLGQYGKAFESYAKRFESKVPFEHEETEILFYRRFGAAAFQVREREKHIQAFGKALHIIDRRIQPKHASEILGRVNRYIFDRIITPALERPRLAEEAKKIAARQGDLNSRLYEAGSKPVGLPPDPGWQAYERILKTIISEQESIIGDLRPLIQKDQKEVMESLGYRMGRVRDALEFPQRFMHLKAEMLDRLGLAYQEAEKWKEARETFERAYTLNERLGIFRNLAVNQRSIAFNAYQEAGIRSGQDRIQLLERSLEGFRKVIYLVRTHGVVKKKKERRKKAVISLAFDIDLDQVSSSQAMYGFSAEQEERLAEAFIARIQMELGQLGLSQEALKRQLERYPPGTPISDKDIYGVSLLHHRAGHLAYALNDPHQAFDHFLRSAELSHRLKNPVSGAINVVNMALTLTDFFPANPKTEVSKKQLLALERKTNQLIDRFPNVFERTVIPSYHNAMGVLALSMPMEGPAGSMENAVNHMEAVNRAGKHFSMGLKWFEKQMPTNDRHALAIRAALHLNMVEVASLLGETIKARKHLESTLKIAQRGLLPEHEWRALAGLGRLKEALEVLESISIIRAGCGRGEITARFSPLVVDLINTQETEEAFNLVERLSEIERVHRMAPMVLGRIAPDERGLLRRIYPRLLTIRDLRRRLAAAKDEKRSYLSERLHQEQRLLGRYIGDNRERLPSLARLAGTEAAQDWVMILLGLANHAEDIADAVVRSRVDVESASLKKEYHELVERYVDALEEARDVLQQGEAPGIMGLMVPGPSEAIDVMESLPEDFTCIRLFPVSTPGSGWIAFTVTPEEIDIKRFDTLSHLEVSGDSPHVLVYEDPSRLPIRVNEPVALSATHLVRSIEYRKPFKRAVLSIPPQYALPEPFDSQSLPVSTTEAEILEGIAQVQTVLLGGTIHKAFSVATRPGQLPTTFMAMTLDQGRRFPLLRLAAGLSNVSLAILPGASLKDAYPIGHLFSLLGVPTVLLPRHPQTVSAFVEPFLRAYATSSAMEAVQTGRSYAGRDEDWVQLGYWGMTEEEANRFARKNFARYVRMGVKAFKTNRHQQALTLFENALNVAAEIEALRRYQTDLHRYARESAYAANQLDKAVQHARALVDILADRKPDTEAHAKALLKLGLVQARAEKYDHAIPALEEAVEIMENLELGPKQVAALSNLGIVLENATEYDRALVKFQSAASLSRSLNKNELLARQYMSIGRIYDLRLSQYARARQSYGEAYAIYREPAQKDRMAQALLDMGRCYRLLGNFREADDHYRRALELVETDNAQLRLKAKIMIEQANNGWYQARYQEAFNLQREVYKLAKQQGWHLEQVIALNTSGLTWWTLGDNQRALRELEDALALAKTLKVRRDEVATTLNNMGLVYREMGLFQKALETLNKALTIDREIDSRWAIAYDLRNMALTYLRMGDAKEAVKLFQEGLVVAGDIGNRINEAKILLGLGEALFTLNRHREARSSFKRALELSRSMVLRETEWRALYGLAKLLLKEGHNHKARDLLVQAATLIDGMRAEIKLNQLKDGFIINKMAVYETLVSLLVDLGEQWKAFDTAERSRARNLIDLLGNQRLDLHGAIDREMYDRQNTLQLRIQEHEELLAQSHDEEERSVYGSALKRLRDQYGDLMLEIQAKNPELASLVSVNPLTLTEVRELLEPGVALLAFYVVPDEIFCWLIKPDSVELFSTPMGRKTLGQSILTYRRIIQNLEPFEVQSKELYSWLLSPVMPKLEDIRILGIVPHGALHYLSFATLHDGDAYVAERFPLFYLPSASVFRYTLNRRTESKNVRVLAIGNPDLKDPALDLPFAEREVATIGWNFPEITVLTKEMARESWVVRHIHEFGIIHLASHGEFNPINPLFSAVKLVEDIHADGDLEASEVFGLRINADLVVLSACQTGLGKVTSGDDVIGMNRAFLYGGSHAILSSLWRVNDISTAILVKQFYRRYVAEKKSESLRRAMLHVKNRYPHPGYWGAFVLTGDYY